MYLRIYARKRGVAMHDKHLKLHTWVKTTLPQKQINKLGCEQAPVGQYDLPVT